MAPPKKNSGIKTKTAAAPREHPKPPNWPPFKPLLPASDLSLSTLVESQIVIVKNFWTGKLCKDYVSFLKTLPLITTPGKPKKGEALRVNDRFQVIDEGFANRLWTETGLRELIGGREGDEEELDYMSKEQRKALWGGEPVGLNPSIRIYRYSKGQFFDCHYDESNVLTLNSTPARTTWTLLLYLTSPATGCQGGETVFYPDDLPGKKSPIEDKIVVGLETGMMLLHKHGDECMLVSKLAPRDFSYKINIRKHEGREVTNGEKWVIRTDLCVKRERTRFAD